MVWGDAEDPNLEVSKLCKLLSAIIQAAGEGLRLFVCDFMSTHITPLSESLLADIAGVGLFAGVSSFMVLHDGISTLDPLT